MRRTLQELEAGTPSASADDLESCEDAPTASSPASSAIEEGAEQTAGGTVILQDLLKVGLQPHPQLLYFSSPQDQGRVALESEVFSRLEEFTKLLRTPVMPKSKRSALQQMAQRLGEELFQPLLQLLQECRSIVVLASGRFATASVGAILWKDAPLMFQRPTTYASSLCDYRQLGDAERCGGGDTCIVSSVSHSYDPRSGLPWLPLAAVESRVVRRELEGVECTVKCLA